MKRSLAEPSDLPVLSSLGISRSKTKGLSSGRKRVIVGLAFASPWIVGFTVFGLYPILMSFYYGFTNLNIFQAPHWVGLQNYTSVVQDPLFWRSLYNTLYITVLGVPLSILLGIGTALLLNQKVRGIGIFRTLIYLPSIVPAVAVAIVWMFILNPDYGLLNAILGWLHLPQPGWLASPAFSKPSLLFMVLWQNGQVMVIMLAGLQDIPTSIYESAQIDGAGGWASFRHITLPMLSPVIFYNVVMGVVGFLQFFAQAFVVTSNGGDIGGPVNTTMFYTTNLYVNAFSNLRMGYASAMAWILFLISLALTFMVFRVGKRAVFYGGE